jgi:hypothetical protein
MQAIWNTEMARTLFDFANGRIDGESRGEYFQCMRCFKAVLEEAGLTDEEEIAERELRDGTDESHSSSDSDCASD